MKRVTSVPEMELIGTTPEGFKLFKRPAQEAKWPAFKLENSSRRAKRNWWLSFNGERLAMGTDAKKLLEHEPEIFQWVTDTLKNAK